MRKLRHRGIEKLIRSERGSFGQRIYVYIVKIVERALSIYMTGGKNLNFQSSCLKKKYRIKYVT